MRPATWLAGLAAPELAADAAPGTLKSPKSRLQELTQRRSGERPEYRLVEVTGPDHQRRFVVEVAVERPDRRRRVRRVAPQRGDGRRRRGRSRRSRPRAEAPIARTREGAAATTRRPGPRRATRDRSRPPPGTARPGLQVVRRAHRRRVRARDQRRHRAQRVRQEQPGRRAPLGARRAGPGPPLAARGGRRLRRLGAPLGPRHGRRRPSSSTTPTASCRSTTRVLEVGRRLFRSGENDYLVNRQRVRLKDLVELLDAAHLADNAFLFIGQGMVDQALALRPEERRPLFEEVAGVRRHERRRRRAEEQLAEATGQPRPGRGHPRRAASAGAPPRRPGGAAGVARARRRGARRGAGRGVRSPLARRRRGGTARGGDARRCPADRRGRARALQAAENRAAAAAAELAAHVAVEAERRAAHEAARSAARGPRPRARHGDGGGRRDRARPRPRSPPSAAPRRRSWPSAGGSWPCPSRLPTRCWTASWRRSTEPSPRPVPRRALCGPPRPGDRRPTPRCGGRLPPGRPRCETRCAGASRRPSGRWPRRARPRRWPRLRSAAAAATLEAARAALARRPGRGGCRP